MGLKNFVFMIFFKKIKGIFVIKKTQKQSNDFN